MRSPQILATCLILIMLAGCASTQVGESTRQLVGTIDKIRRDQVLTNISRAIDDPNFVPVQIVLGTGQTTATVSVQPTIKLPHFDLSQKTKEIDVQGTDTWTSQWQLTAVTATSDLNNLRNLYALVTEPDYENTGKSYYQQLEDYFQPELGTDDFCSTQHAIIAEVWRNRRVQYYFWWLLHGPKTAAGSPLPLPRPRANPDPETDPPVDVPDPFPECIPEPRLNKALKAMQAAKAYQIAFTVPNDTPSDSANGDKELAVAIVNAATILGESSDKRARAIANALGSRAGATIIVNKAPPAPPAGTPTPGGAAIGGLSAGGSFLGDAAPVGPPTTAPADPSTPPAPRILDQMKSNTLEVGQSISNNVRPQTTDKNGRTTKTPKGGATLADAQSVTDHGDDETDTTASWYEGLETIELGGSIGCRLYQRETLRRFLNYDPATYNEYIRIEKIPYRRWLFWRKAGSNNPWEPQLATGADAEDAKLNAGQRAEPTSLGVFGKYELGTTSMACLDDFIALMQSATPKAANASANGPKVQLTH